MVKALDQFAGLGLARQLLAQAVERLLLGFDGDFQLATLDPLHLYAGIRLGGTQLAHVLPLRQHSGAHHAHGQQAYRHRRQADRANAAQALLEYQAVQLKGAHGRSPRWR